MWVPILTDTDLAGDLARVVGLSIDAVRDALWARAAGHLVAPPRWVLDVGPGRLVFTVGAEAARIRAAGFRVYDVYPSRASDHAQVVAVFDSDDGRLRGLVVGDLLGVLRTAAIGAVAIDSLSRPDATVLGVVGTGLQARHHLLAAVAVRDFSQAVVYSRDPTRRIRFAEEMTHRSGVEVIAVDTPETVAQAADVVILATDSRTPVVASDAFEPGTHVTTIGPKFADAHELSPDVAEMASVVVTDSLTQVDAYHRPFFIDVPMVELADVVSGRRRGRTDRDDVTLFCSVGLAGTEVVVADRLLRALT